MNLLQDLEPLLRTFWLIAIPSSLIFLIQTAMTFFGSDASDGLDADFDGIDAPFQLFSFRNLISFLLGFSWTGISFYTMISNPLWLILLSLAVGFVFIGMFFIIIKSMLKLTEDNSFKINHTIDKVAEVYLTIPGQKSGKGKVIVSVNGSVHELAAMTENEAIASGKSVKVVGVTGDQVLLVQSI